MEEKIRIRKEILDKKETCIICMEQFSVEEMTTLYCDHILCGECVARTIKA